MGHARPRPRRELVRRREAGHGVLAVSDRSPVCTRNRPSFHLCLLYFLFIFPQPLSSNDASCALMPLAVTLSLTLSSLSVYVVCQRQCVAVPQKVEAS